MGIFGGSDGDEKEEVTLGMPENNDDSDEGSSAEVRDLDFGSEDDESSSKASSTGSRLERQVESQVATPETDESGDDISLEDVHRQNEEIKDKLDAVLSRL